MARGRIIFSNPSLQIRQQDLLAKQIRNRVFKGKINRPKNRCPSCFHVHNEDVPEKCWIKGMKGDVSSLKDFEDYILENKKGKFM